MNIKNKTKRKSLIIYVVVILVVLSLISIFFLIEKRKGTINKSDLPTIFTSSISSDVLKKIADDTNLTDINLDPLFKDSDPFEVNWRKNNNVRFMRYPDFKTELYRSYKNTDDLLSEYEKVKSVLKSLGFYIDSSRKTISGGDFHKSIIDDFWTNDKEIITINGLKLESAYPDGSLANLTISDLGTVDEIVNFENKIENVVDTYNINIKNTMVVKYGQSEKKSDYAAGTFVKVLKDNQIPVLFTYYPDENNKNIERQLLVLTFQGGEEGFVFYEKNIETNKTKLILMSGKTYSCNDLKIKNISKFETENILNILENSENSWGGRRFFDKQIEDLNLDKCVLNN